MKNSRSLDRLQRSLLGLLCLFLILTCISPLAVYAEETGRQLEKKEVIYAVLRQDGSLSPLMVVNHFNAPEAVSLVDYGAYQEINRLTGESDIQQEGDTITADIPAGDWYYQGVLPDRKLPWSFQFRYELDGKEMTVDELSGKSGRLKGYLTIAPDPEAADVYRDAYFLQISISLDNKKVRSLKAPAALLAVSGKSTLLNFIIYPQKEQVLEFSCSVEDFSLAAPRISALPISIDLAGLDLEQQLPVDQALKTDKNDDLNESEKAVKALSDGMAELKNGSRDIQTALKKISDASAALQKEGSAGLEDGLGKLEEGNDRFTEGLTAYLEGSDQLAAGAAPLQEGLQQFSSGLNQLAQQTESLKNGSQAVRSGLSALVQALQAQGQAAGSPLPDLSALAGQLDGFSAALMQVQGLFNADFTQLQVAFDQLGKIKLPSQDDLNALEASLSEGDSEIHQRQLEQSLTALSGYAAKLYGSERSDYLEELNRLKNLVLISVQDRAAVLGKIQGLRLALTQLKDFDPSVFRQVSASLQQMVEWQKTYGPQIGQLSGQLQGMKNSLAVLSQQSSLAAAGELQKLSGGLSQLSTGMNELDDGLKQYLAGVSSLDQSMPELQKGLDALSGGLQKLHEQNPALKEGADALKEGMGKSREGSAALNAGLEELSKGLGELSGNYGKFQSGMDKMAAGSAEFSEKMENFQEALQGKIKAAIQEAMPTYVPESFVSEKNTKVQSVQFVILGPEIKAAESEQPVSEPVQEEEKSFLERLEDLFAAFK